VAVNGGDTNGVSVGLVPAVTATGSVRVDGPIPENQENPPPAQFFNGRRGGPTCVISLRSGHEQGMPMGWSLFGNGPEFTIPYVFAGQYEVRIQCRGGYAVSALAGGTDLLAQPVLTVPPGAAPPPIEVTMKPGGGSVHAKAPAFPSYGGQPALLLVPAFSSTGPEIGFGMQSGDPDETVGLWASNLAPGDYLAYALTDASSLAYRNPSVLRNLSGGVSVRVEDNRTTEIALPGWVK
jgi:hypothetical protein